MVSSNIHLGGGTIIEGSTIELFMLGKDYEEEDVVLFDNGLYRALANVHDADTVPPLDPTDWIELNAHTMEGYGQEVADAEGGVSFTSMDSISGMGVNRIMSLFIVSSEDISEYLAQTDLDLGVLVSRTDGLEFTFPSGEWQFRLSALGLTVTAGVTPTLTATLQYTTDGMTWADLKTLSLIHISEPTRPY